MATVAANPPRNKSSTWGSALLIISTMKLYTAPAIPPFYRLLLSGGSAQDVRDPFWYCKRSDFVGEEGVVAHGR